jgi:hypothetical protein
MILTPAELVDLTHRQRGAWQAKVLDQWRIPYLRRPDGSLAVLRSDLERKQDQRREPQLRAG